MKTASLFLLFILLTLPFQLMLYSFVSYNVIYAQIGTYDDVDRAVAKEQTAEMIALLSFQDDDAPFMSAEQVSHMKDVRLLFLLLHIMTLSAFIGFVFTQKQLTLKEFHDDTKKIIIFFVIILMFLFFMFDTAFALFHRIFFASGTYTFPSHSNLMLLLQDGFFQYYVGVAGGISLIILIVLYAVTWQSGKLLKEVWMFMSPKQKK